MTMTPISSKSKPIQILLAWLPLILCACASGSEDKRIRQLMNEKGFGTPAAATTMKEVLVGDTIRFGVEPTLVQDIGLQELAGMNLDRKVEVDGTIHVPFVGTVFVLGRTEAELSGLVESRLQRLYGRADVKVTARLIKS